MKPKSSCPSNGKPTLFGFLVLMFAVVLSVVKANKLSRIKSCLTNSSDVS